MYENVHTFELQAPHIRTIDGIIIMNSRWPMTHHFERMTVRFHAVGARCRLDCICAACCSREEVVRVRGHAHRFDHCSTVLLRDTVSRRALHEGMASACVNRACAWLSCKLFVCCRFGVLCGSFSSSALEGTLSHGRMWSCVHSTEDVFSFA